jgi:hypothetical protein
VVNALIPEGFSIVELENIILMSCFGIQTFAKEIIVLTLMKMVSGEFGRQLQSGRTLASSTKA